ncbi:primosomal protein N' [Fonticella tunisiensis]|uniref:Replication restart protein PriA n=1 Tax=Fonticella tunisiensis TaxID=1096341 RepID=A0A4R7KR07_9CLOT|nr:primosomal protein N' [Fonticella tunisiensis]TDT61642.1 replication restart DNA helicase PriA [Fonticella tunisiensis]
MFKIASIIINNSAKEMDREFDYIIPDELEELIRSGMRVIVPFGSSNKYTEGYVMKIKQGTELTHYKLKKIIDVADKDVILTEELIELAYFIKNKYYCTMWDAIQTIVPAGISLKENIYIKLKAPLSIKIPDKYNEILSCIDDKKYVDISVIEKNFNKKLKRSIIFNMEREGIIELKRKMDQKVKEKTLDIYVPLEVEKCNEFIQNPPPRYRKQAEILKQIIDNKDEHTITELCRKYKCTPGVIKGLEGKGLLVKIKKEIYREPVKDEHVYPKVELTLDQKKALTAIIEGYKNGINTFLLHGVTGCGKTEIYLNLVEKFLKHGYGAIVLVPEIALTPQTVERFKGRFGEVVAVLHSRLSNGERFDEWRKIKSGEVKVVVGARSAVFAPVNNLKLIIIDEEHEYSYKSEMTPKYHTREIAEFRIKQNQGLLILGSATPSFESYYNAKSGAYGLVEITRRVDNKNLPEVRIVDMREELKAGNRSIFSVELFDSIKENLNRGHQTILFLNRRGYSTFVSCRACGYVSKCPHCDVSLTYHSSNNKLICHYCGFESKMHQVCPNCESKYIKYFGTGTERIESEIKKYFPNARVLRMDMDTTRKKGEHERIYNEFKNNNADILVGTQMISKGMDFKNVTLVGILAADMILNLPDFRSSERTFQLITQVSGRAGRGDKAGRVIVQTYDPEHYSIIYASKHDYVNFYNREIQIRKMLNHPPFTDILYVLLTSPKEDELIKACMELKDEFRYLYGRKDIEILGPVPNHISKIKNNYRWHIIFKGEIHKYYEIINETASKKLAGTSINFSFDVNPYSMI